MRLYHLCNAEYGLQNLARRRLKISRLNDLNDPFELVGAASRYAEVRRAFEAMKRETATKRGIICFSESWRNPVLWSHYADRHRGVAFGFDVPDGLIQKVFYSSRRLNADRDLLGKNDEASLAFMERALTTKFNHWRYEREWRGFVSLDEKCPETGLYFMEFGEVLDLKEIIVGHSSLISRDQVAAALGSAAASVQVTKARLAFRSFNVVSQRRADLWK